MNYQEAINYVREHLEELHSRRNVYDESETCNIILALEKFAIPAMEKEVPQKIAIHHCTAECNYGHFRCNLCGQLIDWI